MLRDNRKVSFALRPIIQFVTWLALCWTVQMQSIHAQGTPWIGEPRTGSISITFANQFATSYFRGDTEVRGPLEATDAHLSQNTLWFGANYTVSDSIAVDVRSAWARSFLPGAVGPAGGRESYSGLGDSNVGVIWRIVDEHLTDGPSVAVRGALIVAGSYDTGYINSLGDGGHGIETSAIVGKFWRHAGLSGEVGFRMRGSTEINRGAEGGTDGDDVDIPNDVYLNVTGFVPVSDAITLGADYRAVNALGGLDMGGPGFTPSRFPALNEDAHLMSGRLLIDVTDMISLHFYGGQVLAGRNTAKSRFLGGGLTFAFGGAKLGL